MGNIASQFATAFRDFVTDGVSSSGPHDVVKEEVRAIGPLIETAISNAGLGALVDVVKATRSDLDADLAHPADTVALVYADATDANNDLYVKTGASGAGSWTLTTSLHGIIETLAGPYVELAEGFANQAVAAQRYGLFTDRQSARKRGEEAGRRATVQANQNSERCQNKNRPSVGKTYYVNPGATGAADGSSPTDAFTTRAAAYAVAVAGDDVIITTDAVDYTDAGFLADATDNTKVLRQETVSRKSGVREIYQGQVVTSGAFLLSNVENVSGGTYRGQAATSVDWFAYDFKQDDTSGTVTGLDLTQDPEAARRASRRGLTLQHLAAWYGFHTIADPETTTPALGEYSDHSDGWVYFTIDISEGTPLLADVAAKAIYHSEVPGAAVFNEADGGLLSGRNFGDPKNGGNHVSFFFPGTAKGAGYGQRFPDAEDFSCEDQIGICTGYHNAGMSGDSTQRNQFRRMVTVGGSGGIPGVFFNSDDDYVNAGHQDDSFIFISQDYLLRDGSPYHATYKGIGRQTYMHTGGSTVLGGVTVSNGYVFEASALILAKHSIAYPDLPEMRFAGARNTPSYDENDPASYPIQVVNCRSYGPACGPEVSANHVGCAFDSSGVEQTGFSWFTSPREWWMSLEDCQWRLTCPGTTGIPFTQLEDERGGFKFSGGWLYIERSSGTAGFLQITAPAGALHLEIEGLQIDHSVSGGAIVTAANSEGQADLIAAGSFVSGGGNALGANITNPVRNASGTSVFTLAEWQAEYDPDARDLTGVVDMKIGA